MRSPMNDHQFSLAAREHLGAATNEEAYDNLVNNANTRADELARREEAIAVREDSVAQREAAVAAAPVP